MRWLTKFSIPLGRRDVILGGAIQGCELAEFLVKRGREVTVVDTGEIPGTGLEEPVRLKLLAWLDKKGVAIVTRARYKEITPEGLVVLTKEGERKLLRADSIVTALPLTPNTELLEAVRGGGSRSPCDWRLPRTKLNTGGYCRRVSSGPHYIGGTQLEKEYQNAEDSLHTP